MRIHVPCLPHTQLSPAYVHCAYTAKTYNFIRMMRAAGHEVLVYEATDPLPPADNLLQPFDVNDGRWRRHNRRCLDAMRSAVRPRDVLALIAGVCQQPIAAAFPDNLAVEFGVGYYGIFANHCVFESYFHMATVYGQRGWAQGRFFDTVIPNYYDVADFPVGPGGDYLLFVGRLNEDKGIHVAAAAAKHAGLPLVVCGQGKAPKGTDYRGLVGVAERAELMGHARALICPTLYLEPFGGVAVEAQLCGTPVISTDWGGFTETVEDGRTGYRCHYLGEFVQAIHDAPSLERAYIARRAHGRYSLRAIGPQYDAYFRRLELLWDQGWETV